MYPQASPGGWQLIGKTSMLMWDPARVSPAILTPGTRVKFVDRESTQVIETMTKEKRLVRPYLEVNAAALPAFVQDLGRPGHAAIGVSASGALDREALRTANAVAGNPPDLAALEISFGNFSLKFSDDALIACAGAPASITITRASGEIFDVHMNEAVGLQMGDSVKLGYPTQGVRTYLAVRGGIDVPQTLCSSSRDVLAAIGPAPVVKGSILSIGRAAQAPMRPHITSIAAPALPKAGDEVVLDIFVGPRADWFTGDAVQRLCGQAWRVTPQSNRVGLRLHGEKR